MEKIWEELKSELIRALNDKNKTPLTEENLKITTKDDLTIFKALLDSKKESWVK